MSKSSVPTTQGQPSTQVSIARAIWFPTPRKGFVGILDIDADGTIYRGAFVAITAWGSLKTLVPSKGKLPGGKPWPPTLQRTIDKIATEAYQREQERRDAK